MAHTTMTQDMALTLLDTVRTMHGTGAGRVVLMADTIYEAELIWHPTAGDGDGAWHIYTASSDFTEYEEYTDIYEASGAVLARVSH